MGNQGKPNNKTVALIKDALKKSLEGEMVNLAITHRIKGAQDHSKSSSHYHSSSGHCFSRFSQPGTTSPQSISPAESVNETAYEKFVIELTVAKKKAKQGKK